MDELDLRDYLNVIVARKGIIIRTVVVAALVALIWSLLQAPVY